MYSNKSTKIKVCVIVPVYNGSKFVDKAIQSVLNQTFQDFRIIIVDDGSTDKTPSVLSKYAQHKQITVYRFNKNRGQAMANNIALRFAVEPYIAYLDCDDIMYPQKLEKQFNYLEKNKEVGLVYSAVNNIDINGFNITKQKSPNQKIGDSWNNYNSLLVVNFIDRSSVMHRRKCVEDVGNFDTRITGSDDYDMWIRISEKYNIAKIDEPLVDRVYHGENLSSTRPNKNYYHENSIKIISKTYLRRGRPFQIKILWLSKKLRLSIVMKTTFCFNHLFIRIAHKLMYYIDWVVCMIIPKRIIKNRI